MNENVVDILIYLYENYMDGEQAPPTDQNELRDELLQAGFPALEIGKAFDWLDDLAHNSLTPEGDAHKKQSLPKRSARASISTPEDCCCFSNKTTF